MVAESQVRLISTEEFEHIARARDKRYDLVDGVVREMSPAAPPHGRYAWYVGFLLGLYVVPRGLGTIYAAETGFILRRDPDTVRAPDVAFIARERLPEDAPGFGRVIPDFVVEVVSPDDTANDVQEKMNAWIAAGVKVAWVVFPALRLVAIHRDQGRVDYRSGDEEIDAEPTIPGFRCKFADLFPSLLTSTDS